MGDLGAFLSVVLLGATVEGIVEFLIGSWLDNGDDAYKPKWKKMLPQYLALAIGVGVAVLFTVDLFSVFGLEPQIPILSQALTGVLIGRGSNYINDFISKWRN